MMNSENGYRSFEEFERDELRRFETPGASVDDMMDAIFGGEPDSRSGRSGSSRWEDEEEDE